jgi:hypothetical protein
VTSLPQPPAGTALSSLEACACRLRGESDGPHDVADRLGIGVSLTCAIHCAATGALSLLPSLASTSLGAAGEALEWLEAPLLAGALLVGLWSLVPSYRTEHGRPLPLALFLVGLAHLVASRLVEGGAEIVLTVAGVALVATAHALNLRYCGLSHGSPTSHEADCRERPRAPGDGRR